MRGDAAGSWARCGRGPWARAAHGGACARPRCRAWGAARCAPSARGPARRARGSPAPGRRCCACGWTGRAAWVAGVPRAGGGVVCLQTRPGRCGETSPPQHPTPDARPRFTSCVRAARSAAPPATPHLGDEADRQDAAPDKAQRVRALLAQAQGAHRSTWLPPAIGARNRFRGRSRPRAGAVMRRVGRCDVQVWPSGRARCAVLYSARFAMQF